MENQSKTTAKDFFLYLGLMIGLYTSTVSFLILLFQITNKIFPLAGEYIGGTDSGIRISISILFIFFLAFLYLSYIIMKDLKANPEKKDLWVRKWIIFLTLFIAGITIAIDLSTLIYRFLGADDLTLRFFLKVFFVLIVVGTIFRSSLKDLRRTSFEMTRKIKIEYGIVSIIILIGITYGVIQNGSPITLRAKQMDERRLSDLMTIQNQIVYSQWQNKGDIPTNLEVLNEPISGFVIPKDPETRESYEYRKISTNSFELCATFKTGSNDSSRSKSMVINPANTVNENWQHASGRVCFERTIDQKLYPVNPKIVPER
ncbi:MAG: DUF5671 domain-containing protein [bacterium]